MACPLSDSSCCVHTKRRGVVQFQRNTGSFFTIQNDMYVFSFYVWETLDEAFGDEAAWA